MWDLYWIVISVFICMTVPVSMITFAIGLYIGTGYKDWLENDR